MNSEQFNRALNEISDDLIDAAAGAYEKKGNRKKTLIRVAWAACALLVLTAIGVFWNVRAGTVDPTQPTISLQNPTTAPTARPETTEPTEESVPAYNGQLYLLKVSQETDMWVPMQVDMTYGMDNTIRIRYLSEMTEEEKEQAIKGAVIQEGFGGNSDGYYLMRRRYWDVIYEQQRVGNPSLILPNCEDVVTDERETNGVFSIDGCRAWYTGDETFSVGGTTVTIPKDSYRIFLHVSLTDETLGYLSKNPDTPLSELKDTITVTVKYKDGTKAVIVVDVTMNDEGQVFLSMRGDHIGV